MKKILTAIQIKEVLKDRIVRSIFEDRINSREFRKMDYRAKLGGFKVVKK